MIDKFDYIKIKTTINKVKKTNNKLGENCSSYSTGISSLTSKGFKKSISKRSTAQ